MQLIKPSQSDIFSGVGESATLAEDLRPALRSIRREAETRQPLRTVQSSRLRDPASSCQPVVWSPGTHVASRHQNLGDLVPMNARAEDREFKLKPSTSQEGPVPATQCDRCAFRVHGKAVCVAFPWGIPAEIKEGRIDHTQPYPGDGGFRFVPRQ